MTTMHSSAVLCSSSDTQWQNYVSATIRNLQLQRTFVLYQEMKQKSKVTFRARRDVKRKNNSKCLNEHNCSSPEKRAQQAAPGLSVARSAWVSGLMLLQWASSCIVTSCSFWRSAVTQDHFRCKLQSCLSVANQYQKSKSSDCGWSWKGRRETGWRLPRSKDGRPRWGVVPLSSRSQGKTEKPQLDEEKTFSVRIMSFTGHRLTIRLKVRYCRCLWLQLEASCLGFCSDFFLVWATFFHFNSDFSLRFCIWMCTFKNLTEKFWRCEILGNPHLAIWLRLRLFPLADHWRRQDLRRVCRSRQRSAFRPHWPAGHCLRQSGPPKPFPHAYPGSQGARFCLKPAFAE